MTHQQVPLKNLRFGHEAPNHPGNARTTGREDGIAELAAHIHNRGKIDDLLVYDDGVPPLLFVANGNRSLAALRMIHGEKSEELVDCKLTTAEQAYEDSLAVSVLAKKFHPVDEYEGYARLRDEKGKSNAEIAKQYGMTEREVDQVMALGHLSPAVREAWRKGELKADAAKAFTLAADHAAQDKLLADLREEAQKYGDDLSRMDSYEVKEMLNINTDGGALVEFVGVEAYVKRGGKVTLDLFGIDHQVSDVKLAAKMADEKLADECKRLKAEGWSFAVTASSVRNTQHSYSTMKAEAQPTEEETARLAQLDDLLATVSGRPYPEMPAQHQKAFVEKRERLQAITARAFTEKMRAKAGCFVSVDDDGLLEIVFGKVKPAQKETAAKVQKEETRAQAKVAAKTAAAEGKPAPESKVLSNALKERLECQLVAATRDAIAAEPLLVNSALFEVLARTVCSQINPDRPHFMAHEVKGKLPTIRQALNPGVFNAALAKRFDAEDYFSSAPKGFVVKAIAEAINQDEARRISGKSKAEVWKFALANLAKTGWLPKELRTVHYAGPGSEGYKPPAASAAITAVPEKPAGTAEQVKAAKAERANARAEKQMKRAAAAKKSAKKASKKKQ